MATMSRANLLRETLPGLNAMFGLEYERYAEQHKEIYEIENSSRSFEEELKLAGFQPAGVKEEGAAIEYQTGAEVWTARYVHENIAMGFALTEEAVDDNLYDSLSARYTKALARAMAYTKQVKAAAVLNQAFTAGVTGGDGVSLINASHPTLIGSVNSNTAGAVDISEAALENMAIQIASWVDEKGLLIAAKLVKVIVPPNSAFEITRILNTELRVGTPNNDINAIKDMGVIPGGFVVNNFLTDTDSWYVKTDVPNGLKHYIRKAMTKSMDGDFDTGNVKYKASERYSFGWTDPLSLVGSAGG